MSILDRVVDDVKSAPAAAIASVEDAFRPSGPIPLSPSAAQVKEMDTPIDGGNPPGFPAEVPIGPANGAQRNGNAPTGIQATAARVVAQQPVPTLQPMIKASILPEPVVAGLAQQAQQAASGVHMPSYIAGLHDGAHALLGMQQPVAPASLSVQPPTQPTLNTQ